MRTPTPRRLFAFALWALVCCAPLLFPGAARAGDAAIELRDFAARVGLHDVDGFVNAVESLRADRHLPANFVTKRRARQLGWKPGEDLCRYVPGGSIGGDAFGNRQGQLPSAAGRRWREADLDYGCGKRGARRLLWSTDGLIFVTVDHYQHFTPVPPAAPR